MSKNDNNATNMLTDYLGGPDVVNSYIKEIGLKDSTYLRKMLDVNAKKAGRDNYTTAKDFGNLLCWIYNDSRGNYRNFSPLTRSVPDGEVYAGYILNLMYKNRDRQGIPKYIDYDATVYNKTGLNPNGSQYSNYNDAAIVETPRGTFVLVILQSKGDFDTQRNAAANVASEIYDIYMSYN